MTDLMMAAQKVSSMPYFWNVMGLSTIMASFFGAAIYDGEITGAKRGVAAVGSYIFLLFLLVFTYIYHRYPVVNTSVRWQLFIFPVEVLYVSFFWFIGFAGAIIVFRHIARKKRR